MKKALLSMMLLLFPMINLFADITGEYTLTGFDPHENKPYTGSANIVKDGEVFKIHWKFSDGSKAHGTGVHENQAVSFVFQTTDTPKPNLGVQMYHVLEGELKGPWVYQGGEKVGHETLTKVAAK